MIKEYIEKLRPLVVEYFKDDYTGHDLGHLERTLNNALYMCEKEGGDPLVVALAAYLHDIHRIMQNETGIFVSPKESLPKVREFLSIVDLTEEQKEKICYCIEHHEIYNWNGNNVSDIDALIVQDADNLDAIGAMGIGRAFNYGGGNNIRMYDESIPLNENNDFVEAQGDKESTIHHFYHKLFKLADQMNTKTARDLAKQRTEFMKQFTKQFFDEWNANY